MGHSLPSSVPAAHAVSSPSSDSFSTSVPASRANAQPSDTPVRSDEGCASQSLQPTPAVTDHPFPGKPSVDTTSLPQRAMAQPIDTNTKSLPYKERAVRQSYAEGDGCPSPHLELQQLSLEAPAPPSTWATHEAPTSSRVRTRTDAFSIFREPSSLVRTKSLSLDPSNDTVPGPSKRARTRPTNIVTASPGIQPHPAHPPRWEHTPADYTNKYAHLHPWGIYIEPRPRPRHLSEAVVSADLPTHVYRFIPQDGYFASRFVRSLFPRRFVGLPGPANKIPILELQRLDDIIAFRQHAVQLTEELTDGVFTDDFAEFLRLPRNSFNGNTTCLYPPARNGVFPVLYQVVSRSGVNVILEAKDFFIPGPDLPELQCLPLTQDSVNVLSRTRGFDRDHLSVKDFIWVYTLRPTTRTLGAPDRREILREARRPRPVVMDSSVPYFFRVHEFIPVTPSSSPRNILGLVISVTRRGLDHDHVSNFFAAFEGSHEAIRVPPNICDFPVADVERDMFLLARSRTNVSCAMRFSHSAVSVDAQRFLVNAVKRFLPAHPEEALLPLCVSRMLPEDLQWIADRDQDFLNYNRDRRSARVRMHQLFAVASSALAAYNVWSDDKATHEVSAFVPSMDALPLRLMVNIDAMAAQGGWTRSRVVHTWVINSTVLQRSRIAAATFHPNRQSLAVELHSEPHRHQSLLRAIRRHGATRTDTNEAFVPLCVRLARAPIGTDPVFNLLADDTFSNAISNPDIPSRANVALDMVYSSRPRSAEEPPQGEAPATTILLQSVNLRLHDDQSRAVQMALGNHSLLAIQAAFGTGKTVVGALVAARLADQGKLVLVTATTNVAVAQFTETLLKLDEYKHLKLLRFVADSALREGAPTTSVDLHNVLRGLLANFSDKLERSEHLLLTNYAHGRGLVERLLLNPEATLHLTDEQREQYRIAENSNSEDTEEAVKIMLRVRFPDIVCMTTSSLLSTTRVGGLFPLVFSDADAIIGDEASQIPEPAFVALAARFSTARHIYIGDVNQLEPHVRCPRSSVAARFGGKGLMTLLVQKDLPLASLVTSSRAHPALNSLPNSVVYGGSLVNGTAARQRQLVTSRLSLPNPTVPFVFVDVRGRSRMSPAQSYYNPTEALCCEDLVCALLAKDFPATSIAVITFYKEQERRLEDPLRRLNVPLYTVDSVQGKEMDVVIILTTRSEIYRDSGAFLDDIRRLNVAITRCKHGQFILGHVDALRRLPNWGRVLQWATERNTIISESSLPDIFA